MVQIIAKATTTLKIPPNFKGLTGREWLIIEFEAGVPTEVSDKVAEYYTKNWDKKFKYATDESESELENDGSEDDEPIEFDPIDFLEKNYDKVDEAINELTNRKELLALCKALRFNSYVKQSNERLKERIINDIAKKKELDAEINKGSEE